MEILQGNIKPSPIRLSESDKPHCVSCEFAGVCGVQKTEFAMGRKCYADVKIDAISKLEGENNGK